MSRRARSQVGTVIRTRPASRSASAARLAGQPGEAVVAATLIVVGSSPTRQLLGETVVDEAL